MVRHTLKILQQMLQDFKSVSDHFGTLCIKGLTMEMQIKLSTECPGYNLIEHKFIRKVSLYATFVR